MKKIFPVVFCTICTIAAHAQTFDLCDDFKKTESMANDPDGFKSGEAKSLDEMWNVYKCAITFTGATKADARYWVTGKLSNVIQYFGESLPEQQALNTYDALAKQFRTCYSALKEEPGALGLRNDISFQIHENLIARLTMYHTIDPELGNTGYSVFLDMYYTGE